MKRYYTYKPDRHALKARLKKLGKFSLTVALGAGITLLAFAVQPKSPVNKPSKSTAYSYYLKGVFKTLRAERKVRMVNLRLPATILNRRAIAEDTRAEFEIISRTRDIPVVAVSKNAKHFLEKMGVVAIDPGRLPTDTFNGVELPLSSETLKQFVLVPDVASAEGVFLVKAR